MSRRYGLNKVGHLAVDPERRPGAASLRALRDIVSSLNVRCAFTEPQFDAAVVQELAGDSSMQVSVLDALGSGLEPGPDLYSELLERNAHAVQSCLGPNT
jgi:zinc transport system substrate-binding protein